MKGREKYIILGAVILVIIPFLILISFTKKTSIPSQNVTPTPTKRIVPKTASIYFEPSTLTLTSSGTQTVDLMVDAGDSTISGAQIEAVYDPKILTSLKITQASGEGMLLSPSESIILINKVDPAKGRISYAVGLSPNSPSKSGKGKIATLTFFVNQFNAAKTQILFSPGTLVTKDGEIESVLKSVQPLVIIFNPSK